VARRADVAILVVGENESTNREAWPEGRLGDRDSLDLPGAQNSLVQAVVETGTPTVVLLINGRPLSINYIAEHVPAILEGWRLGQEGGTAAARVLFGDVNPGGKLPITFPHSVGDLPDFYNRKPSAGRGYAFGAKKPLCPFGYGLSYTTFRFDNLRVEPPKIVNGGTAKVSAVTGVYGETGLPAPPPPPQGSEAALVSTFDDLKVTGSYGSWTAASDTMSGGRHGPGAGQSVRQADHRFLGQGRWQDVHSGGGDPEQCVADAGDADVRGRRRSESAALCARPDARQVRI
jgi:hypothetical protein